jgi:hypothetical protein
MSLYFIYARLIPAIIVSLPFWFLLYGLNQIPQVANVFSSIQGMKFVGNITISVVFQYGWAMLVREVGKHYEEKYFERQLRFPSVYFLMRPSDTFSEEFKQKIRDKTQAEFGLMLPKGVPGDEKLASDIAKLILEKVRYTKEVNRHNTWYGFYRNLFAGGILGLLLSIAMIIVGVIKHQSYSIWIGTTFAGIYLVIFLLKRRVIVRNGEQFARQMYYSYLTTPADVRRQGKEGSSNI